jgi:predicted AAA+ superfamily ATPase
MKKYQRDLLKLLIKRVNEPRKTIQVLTGPRQVGKTTLLHQLEDKKLLFTRYLNADEVVADAAWLDQAWNDLRLTMRANKINSALLIVDEVQRLNDWSLVVKRNWDRDSREKIKIKVLLTGSSRLLLQKGLSESLMGRFEIIRATHWSYWEMKSAFAYTPEEYVYFGGYPGAASYKNDELRFKEYIKNSMIESSISHDILMLTQINKPALLRRLFELAVAYNAQIVSYNKFLGQLQDAGNTTTLAQYAILLGQAKLIDPLDKYSTKAVKIKSASPKFQVYNTALISALGGLSLSEAATDSAVWGRLVEGCVGAYLLNEIDKNPKLKMFYWRDGDSEVDFVLQNGKKIIGLEVKSQSYPAAGLTEFKRHYPRAATYLIGETGIKWFEFIAKPLSEWLRVF